MRARFTLVAIGLLVARTSIAAPPPEPKFKLVPQAPPATPVDSVAVSPDGSLVATAAGEGGVRLYEAQSGRLLRVLGDVGDRCVVFSPDGHMLTAAGFHMDKLVALWDVQSGKRLRTFSGQLEWEEDATAISPDGKLLASSGTDKQILIWEIASGKLLWQIKDQPTRVSALAFSPDSATLASGGGDKIVRLWDCATGKVRQSLGGQSDWICTIAYSPDGRMIASGSCDWGWHRGHNWPRSPLRGIEQCEWRLWDAASGKLLRSQKAAGRMLSLGFAPGSKMLACGIGRDVKLFDLSSQAEGKTVANHDADVTSVAFTPDGAAIISASHDQTTKSTRLPSREIQWHTPGYFETVNAVALSKDASILVTGSSDWRFARGWLRAGASQLGQGAVRVWDAHSGRMLRRLSDSAEQIMAAAISPDGRRIAAGGGTADGKGTVHVWDAASGAPLWSTSDHGSEVLAISFAPDGSALASASADGIVKIREAQTGRVSQTLTNHIGGATALAFSPDGNNLFCGQAHGGTRMWEVHSGRLLQTLHVADSSPASFTVDRQTNSIGLSADGSTLAVCASSVNDEFVDAVRFWDARTGKLLRDFSAEGVQGQPMALSPDGSLIATGGKSIKLWDARTGKLVRELYGFLKRTQAITFSADGKLIVSGGSYGTTNLWEVATGRHMATLFAPTDPQTGAATDDWLAYTPNGYYDGSAGAQKFLAWRVGDELLMPQILAPQLHQPQRVAAALVVD